MHFRRKIHPTTRPNPTRKATETRRSRSRRAWSPQQRRARIWIHAQQPIGGRGRAQEENKVKQVRAEDLVLGVELLLELGDLPLLGGGEVLGVVPAHLVRPGEPSLPYPRARRSLAACSGRRSGAGGGHGVEARDLARGGGGWGEERLERSSGILSI